MSSINKFSILTSCFVAACLAIILGTGCSKTETPSDSNFHYEASEDICRAMEQVYPSLIRLNVVIESASGGRMKKHQIAGSGAIISKEGHIITNHHVAGKATRIVCRMPDGEEIEGTLIGTDALADIAIVKLNLDHRKKNTPLPVATFGDSDAVNVGDVVFSMGSPAALSQSVTQGIVSNTAMIMPKMGLPIRFTLDGEDTGTLVRWIGHDAVIFGGNSGGPLVNTKGEIIGINEIGIGSLGGAIPSNLAKSVAQQLINTGTVKRSWTGMECQPRLKNSPVSKGVLVGGVIKDSPAEQAGLKAGDIITSFDGTEVDCRINEDIPVFNRLVLSTPIGKKVKLTAIRQGNEKYFELTTTFKGRARQDDIEFKMWGLTVRPLTRMAAMELKRPDEKGIYVSSVRAGGPCGQAKPSIKRGDIIRNVAGHTVDDLAQLRKISESQIEGMDDPVSTLVEFERKDKKYLTVVDLGPIEEADKPLKSKKVWFPAAVQVLTEDIAKAVGLEKQKGVRITQIYDGYSAEEAGLKVGDILIKLDGDKIDVSKPEDKEVFDEMIRQYKIGSEVSFDLIRDKQQLKILVTLEAPLKSANELNRYKDEYFEMTVRQIVFQDRLNQKLDKDTQGVLIERVERAGWASIAGLFINDILLSINGNDINDIDAVKTILNEAKEKKTKRLVFFVKRGIHTEYLELEPKWDKTDYSLNMKLYVGKHFYTQQNSYITKER